MIDKSNIRYIHTYNTIIKQKNKKYRENESQMILKKN